MDFLTTNEFNLARSGEREYKKQNKYDSDVEQMRQSFRRL